MKKTLLGISLMALSLAAAVPMAAYAVPHDAPPRDGKAVRPPLPPLSEEQIAQARSLAKEYREAVSPLREQLREKKMELKALSPNPNTKPEELRQIIRDIIALEKQIDVQKEAFREKMDQAGIPCPVGKGHERPGPRPHPGFCGPDGPRHDCWGRPHGHCPAHGGCW